MEKKDLKVLVCDDSLLIRKKMKDALAEIGIDHISEAENGQEAVQFCKNNDVDVIFMDIVMPEKDGITALTEIKELDKDVKVVMVSSAGTQSHLKKAVKLGVYDFIQKPINKNALEQIIEKILKESEDSNV